jgi:hypothetical protein
MLFPERPLLISPTLAATIGLEEAVMLHVLDELMQRQPSPEKGKQQWLDVSHEVLSLAMPFWDTADIARIQQNLLEKGLIEVDEAGSKAGNVRIALGRATNPTLQAVAKAPAPLATGKQPAAPSRPNAGGKATQIPADWYPNDDLYQLCAKRTIPRTFVDDHVRLFVISQQERKKTQYSWHNTFYKYIVREWESSRSHQGLKELEANMSADWQPSEDAFSILEHAGINHSFIEDAVPEFVLYWRETGLKTSTWNTKFIAHVRRQWAKYEAALEHDTAPKLIAEDYRPSDEVYDVLELANIDLKFAQELIPEFVLYWRERKEVSASWHTKFLQHVKFKWAHRQEDKGDFIERVTDRSWAN